MSNSLDDNIHQQTPVTLATIDINVMVTPGHDMVVNHVDGSQELAQGSVALAVMAQEAVSGEHVDPADVTAQSSEAPRSSDPETNGIDQQTVAASNAVASLVAATAPVVEEPVRTTG